MSNKSSSGMLSKKVVLGVAAAGALAAYTLLGYRKVKDLKGKTALITGAAGGLGRAICLELAKKKEITTFILWDLQLEETKITADQIKQLDPNATIHLEKVNLAERANIYTAAENACRLLGGNAPYLIVNNAGIISGNQGSLETPDAKIELETKVNALAHVWIAKAFIPKMIEKNTGGHFLNVASIAGFVASGDMSTYAMSKKAARGYAEGLNAELKIRGYSDKIKISLLCPGHILTKLFEGFQGDGFSMTAEYVAARAVRAVEGEVELTILPDVLAPTAFIIGMNEYFRGKLNLPLIKKDYTPMKGWSGAQADKLYQHMGAKM